MKVIEILNLNRELLIYFQKAGIRLDDVQYIDLFNEYRSMSTQGEKVSYIVARLASEYAISERKVYSLIRRFKTDCNLLAVQRLRMVIVEGTRVVTFAPFSNSKRL